MLEAVSRLTDRYQTTVPREVRNLLGLRKGDRIRYRLGSDGRVYIEPERKAEDPALGAFLDLLERDVAVRPDRIAPVSPELADRMRRLVGDVGIDLDTPLDSADE
ncbi:MAG: hypothetical protein KatS3mg119_1543 [Rhodothalassiaceae bacterium]|nr:MAG: hypothetical protein KatS3mg119_1543 [Rhodothalassiaceae bacterium]